METSFTIAWNVIVVLSYTSNIVSAQEQLNDTAVLTPTVPPIPNVNALFFEWTEYRVTHSKNTCIIRSVSALLSMVASCIQIWMILRSHKRLSSTSHRLLIGMCTSDVIYSISMSFFNVMAPSDDSYYSWNARGNTTSCDIQGFIQSLGYSLTSFYIWSLNIYFLSVVKYQKSDEYIRTKIEPFLHIFTIATSLLLCILALIRQNFNDGGIGSCTSFGYEPPHCQNYENGYIPEGFDIPCGRGLDGATIVFVFLLCITVATPVILGGTLTMIYKAVLQVEKTLDKYSVGVLRDIDVSQVVKPKRALSLIISKASLEKNNHTLPSRPNTTTRSHSRAVMQKAVAYSCSYLLTWLFIVIYAVFRASGKESPLAILYLVATFIPLQGLFNLLIFMHPRMISSKTRENLSWRRAFVDAFWSRGDTTRSRSTRSSALA